MLNLTWNKQINFNKLDPFSRVFEIALRETWLGEIFLLGGGNLTRSDFDHSNLFQSQKQHSVNIEHCLKSKSLNPSSPTRAR